MPRNEAREIIVRNADAVIDQNRREAAGMPRINIKRTIAIAARAVGLLVAVVTFPVWAPVVYLWQEAARAHDEACARKLRGE